MARIASGFPAMETVHGFFTRWSRMGWAERMRKALRERVRVRAGRHRVPSAAAIDSHERASPPRAWGPAASLEPAELGPQRGQGDESAAAIPLPYWCVTMLLERGRCAGQYNRPDLPNTEGGVREVHNTLAAWHRFRERPRVRGLVDLRALGGRPPRPLPSVEDTGAYM